MILALGNWLWSVVNDFAARVSTPITDENADPITDENGDAITD